MRVEDEVRVEGSCLPFLVLSIEGLEHILPNQLVVSIEVKTDGVFAAVFMVGDIVVFHGSLPLGVVDINILVRGYFVKLEVFAIDCIAAIWRCIV